MKIAIPSSGKTLNSPVDPRFGRCPLFLIIDLETMDFRVIENEAGSAARGAGVTAAQIVADSGVGAVLAGNIGPNAFYALNAAGIKIFSGAFGITAKEALKRYKNGGLKETTAAPRGFGSGQRVGRGGGY
jgi:predicted Fe-Mo cluster-binding NifX family protein